MYLSIMPPNGGTPHVLRRFGQFAKDSDIEEY